MSWIIQSKFSGEKIGKSFQNKDDANFFIRKMGRILSENYKAVYVGNNSKISRMINEGLVRNDLQGILGKKISIDEYTPRDPKSDNIVIGFFIHQVPEAVEPLSNYLNFCDGVLDVDFGDSDTIPNCSIVYCEFDREKFKISYIHNIVGQLSLLSGIKGTDFSLSFPNSDKIFPYSDKLIEKYFKQRSIRDNKIAQQKAIETQTKEIQRDLDDDLESDKHNTEDDKDENEKDTKKEDTKTNKEEKEQPKQDGDVPKKSGKPNPVDTMKKMVGEAIEKFVF